MQVQHKVQLLTHTYMPTKAIAMGARLCYSGGQIDDLKDILNEEKLINKLVDMGHLSPIEHASFTFGIEGVSRALLAQITRHRIASFSVQSQRYVGQSKAEGEFNYIIPPAIEKLGDEAVSAYEEQMHCINKWYEDWCTLLGEGEKSNEDARFILPNACETRMIVTMNARELLHFFTLRCCKRAQWEIRQVAWDMLRLVKDIAPEIFENAGPNCKRDGCSEGKMGCKE